MSLNMAELKKSALAMEQSLEMWSGVVEMIEMIDTNKQFLKVAEGKKKEYEGNKVAVAELSNQLGGLNDDIACARATLVRLNGSVNTDVAVYRKQEMHKVDQELSDRRVSFEDTLKGVKDDVKAEVHALKVAQQELAETKAELRSIRASIGGVL